MSALHLSSRQLAGLRLMVGFNGTELNAELKWLIGTLNVGGVILFLIYRDIQIQGHVPAGGLFPGGLK